VSGMKVRDIHSSAGTPSAVNRLLLGRTIERDVRPREILGKGAVLLVSRQLRIELSDPISGNYYANRVMRTRRGPRAQNFHCGWSFGGLDFFPDVRHPITHATRDAREPTRTRNTH
jgi:hypothetical protein